MFAPGTLLYEIATWLVPLVCAIVFHELAHGYVARLCGDPTASRMGRLSFNPIRHADPIGTVLLPMMLALIKAPIFGWARPVPVDPAQMRHPRRDMMLVAIAGPMTNFILALIAAIVLGLMMAMRLFAGTALLPFLSQSLENFIVVNAALGMFNLLPIPPFDGSHIVAGLLPPSAAAHYARLARFGMLIPIVLFIVIPQLFPGAAIAQSLIGAPVGAFLHLLDMVVNAITGTH